MNHSLEHRARRASQAVLDASHSRPVRPFTPPGPSRGAKVGVVLAGLVLVTGIGVAAQLRNAPGPGDHDLATEDLGLTIPNDGTDASTPTPLESEEDTKVPTHDTATLDEIYYVIDHQALAPLSARIKPAEGWPSPGLSVTIEIYGDANADNPFEGGYRTLTSFEGLMIDADQVFEDHGPPESVAGSDVWFLPDHRGPSVGWPTDSGGYQVLSASSSNRDEMLEITDRFFEDGFEDDWDLLTTRGGGLAEWFGDGVFYWDDQAPRYHVAWSAETNLFEHRAYFSWLESNSDESITPKDAWETTEAEVIEHDGVSLSISGVDDAMTVEFPADDGYITIVVFDEEPSIDEMIQLVDSVRPASEVEVSQMTQAGVDAIIEPTIEPEPSPQPTGPDSEVVHPPPSGLEAATTSIGPETIWILSYVDGETPCVLTASPLSTDEACANKQTLTAADGSVWHAGYANSQELVALDTELDSDEITAVRGTTFGGDAIEGEIVAGESGPVWRLIVMGPAEEVPQFLHLETTSGEVVDFALPEYVGESIDTEGLPPIGEDIEYIISIVPYRSPALT